MERLRAHDVVRATIAREAKQQAADAKAYEIKTAQEAQADAQAYQQEVEAKAAFTAATQRVNAETLQTRAMADAGSYAALRDAEARLAMQLKEAEGMSAIADAYARMAGAFGGPAGLLQYLMIKEGTFVALAAENAKAVQNLQPKITVWNTGAQGEGSSANASSIDTMRSKYSTMGALATRG